MFATKVAKTENLESFGEAKLVQFGYFSVIQYT